MKQLFALFIALFLIVPVAFAEDNDTETDDIEIPDDGNETEEEDETEEEEDDDVDNPSTGEDAIDNTTEEEVGAIKDHRGAKVRLLQLEKRITRNTIRAEGVVAYITENYSDADVTELETLIEEMGMLLEDVKAVTTDNPDYGTVKQFVDLKNDAIELTKSFRDKARAILKEEDIEGLKKQLEEREQKENQLREKQQEVLKAVREHNAHRIEVMLEALGEEDSELVEKVKSGELNYGQANQELRKHYAVLEPEQKEQVRAKVKEEAQVRKDFKTEAVKLAKEQYLDRREERLRERIAGADKFNESAVANSLLSARLIRGETNE